MNEIDKPRLSSEERIKLLEELRDTIRFRILVKTYVFVGVGSEELFGTTKARLRDACTLLVESGYKVYYLKIEDLLEEGEDLPKTAKVITFGTRINYLDVWRSRMTILKDIREDFAAARTAKEETA